MELEAHLSHILAAYSLIVIFVEENFVHFVVAASITVREYALRDGAQDIWVICSQVEFRSLSHYESWSKFLARITRIRSSLPRLAFIFSLTPLPIVSRSLILEKWSLSFSLVCMYIYIYIYTHTHTHTYTMAISIGFLLRIPRRKTTLTLSRSGELGLSRESGFEGSRVNRHLE